MQVSGVSHFRRLCPFVALSRRSSPPPFRAELMKGPAAEWEFKDVHAVSREAVLSYFEPCEALELY